VCVLVRVLVCVCVCVCDSVCVCVCVSVCVQSRNATTAAVGTEAFKNCGYSYGGYGDTPWREGKGLLCVRHVCPEPKRNYGGHGDRGCQKLRVLVRRLWRQTMARGQETWRQNYVCVSVCERVCVCPKLVFFLLFLF